MGWKGLEGRERKRGRCRGKSLVEENRGSWREKNLLLLDGRVDRHGSSSALIK